MQSMLRRAKELSEKKAKAVGEKLRSVKLKEATKQVKDGIEEALTYRNFSGKPWTRTLTSNVIERLN